MPDRALRVIQIGCAFGVLMLLASGKHPLWAWWTACALGLAVILIGAWRHLK